MEWPPQGKRYVALQIGFDAITSFNELITTVHKFNNDSFTFNDFISRALTPSSVVCCPTVAAPIAVFFPQLSYCCCCLIGRAAQNLKYNSSDVQKEWCSFIITMPPTCMQHQSSRSSAVLLQLQSHNNISSCDTMTEYPSPRHHFVNKMGIAIQVNLFNSFVILCGCKLQH